MAEISQLTISDVNDLFEYWREHPPTHVLVAAYLMGASHDRPSKKGGKTNEFQELTRSVTAAGGDIHKRLPEIYRSDNTPP